MCPNFAPKGKTYFKGSVWERDTATGRKQQRGKFKGSANKLIGQLAFPQIGFKKKIMARTVISMSKNKYKYSTHK